MGYEMLLIKSPHRMESRKLGLALLVGFCIGVVTSFISITLSTAEQQFSWAYGARANPSPEINPHPRMSGRSATGVIRMNQTSSSTNYTAHSTAQAKDDAAELASGKETEEANHGENAAEGVQHTTQKQQTIESKPPGTGDHFNEHIGFDRAEAPKAACDLSNPRTDVCELHGDVRIHGKSSSVVLVSADRQPRNPERRRSWQIKPYARKFDKAAMAHIQEVSVGSSNGLGNDVPRCTTNYSVPAVVFAIGGYTGNYYHDFTDVLVPLFITSRRFDGEVQLVIATKKLWWISKYEPILRKLSRYEIVYSGSDDRVHCYPHAIVGLHSHKAMSIDPARAPNGYSMVDFTRFMRSTYSLGRDFPIRLGDDGGRKPRLLLIPRQGTRRFTNFQEIVGGGGVGLRGGGGGSEDGEQGGGGGEGGELVRRDDGGARRRPHQLRVPADRRGDHSGSSLRQSGEHLPVLLWVPIGGRQAALPGVQHKGGGEQSDRAVSARPPCVQGPQVDSQEGMEQDGGGVLGQAEREAGREQVQTSSAESPTASPSMNRIEKKKTKKMMICDFLSSYRVTNKKMDFALYDS
ncbi:Glycosyltransferase [Musa troglodytarum]|uniref:Glycosyltransferase n=1 Tax=Musa troglodytarum TaxID=320322 RepID=A0A9E7H607_9LILI|nr:Glycosyltransferase [Musa troglodytarum]